MGPDFMTDMVVVETSDHARLQILLCYNWKFDVDRRARAGGPAPGSGRVGADRSWRTRGRGRGRGLGEGGRCGGGVGTSRLLA